MEHTLLTFDMTDLKGRHLRENAKTEPKREFKGALKALKAAM